MALCLPLQQFLNLNIHRRFYHTKYITGQTALCAHHEFVLNSCLQKCNHWDKTFETIQPFPGPLYLLPVPEKTTSWKTVIGIPSLCIKIGQTSSLEVYKMLIYIHLCRLVIIGHPLIHLISEKKQNGRKVC